MRLFLGLLGLLALALPATAQAADCENSPYNCKVPNTEDPPLKNGEKLDHNRKFNDFDQTYLWGLVNQPELKDGAGNVRGHVKGDAKFNFGQRKTIGGEGHVYAFAVGLVEGGAVSGWVTEASVYRQNTIAKMPTSSPGKPDAGYYQTDWVISGGDLTAAGALALNEKYGNRKVNPNIAADEHQAASDYLVRQWDPVSRKGYINFLYNLPGVGGMTTDTLPMCVHFKRFKGVPELEIELYFVDSSTKSDLTLHFDFGEIDGRRGWITKEMLTAAQDINTLAPDHPCRTTVDPGTGGMGQGGSGDPGGSGGDTGAAGDPGAGGQQAGGSTGDAGTGQGGESPAGAGGIASGAGGAAIGTGGAAASAGKAQGGAGAGGTKASGGGTNSGGAASGAGGKAAGAGQGGAGGVKSGAGGASAGASAATGGAPGEGDDSGGEASSDGGCALVSPRARSRGGMLGLALALGIVGRRWRRRERAAG